MATDGKEGKAEPGGEEAKDAKETAEKAAASSVSASTGGGSVQWYERAYNYWEDGQNCPPDDDGVLGGYGHISPTDIAGSKIFLDELKAMRPLLGDENAAGERCYTRLLGPSNSPALPVTAPFTYIQLSRHHEDSRMSVFPVSRFCACSAKSNPTSDFMRPFHLSPLRHPSSVQLCVAPATHTYFTGCNNLLDFFCPARHTKNRWAVLLFVYTHESAWILFSSVKSSEPDSDGA